MFPTYVGMNRQKHRNKRRGVHVPHIRGDEPVMNPTDVYMCQCSPHTWG